MAWSNYCGGRPSLNIMAMGVWHVGNYPACGLLTSRPFIASESAQGPQIESDQVFSQEAETQRFRYHETHLV
jgi:hypothetical protein